MQFWLVGKKENENAKANNNQYKQQDNAHNEADTLETNAS